MTPTPRSRQQQYLPTRHGSGARGTPHLRIDCTWFR